METEKKLERNMRIAALCLLCFVLLALIYSLYNVYSTGAASLEHAMKKTAGPAEDFCSSRVINETTGVGFINYDCTPINKITKGVKDCKGQYYVFATRTNSTWIVNLETKTVIW